MFIGSMFLDWSYIVLVVPALLLAMWAQWSVSSTFSRYSSVSSGGCTGAGAARAILDANGLWNVRVERVAGNLTDHFDPRTNVIRLSDGVYGAATVAAVGVAAHEAGHAVQHAVGYTPMKLRAAILPVTNFGSQLSMPLILIGALLQLTPLVEAGLLLFSGIALFQLVTLPVELNASGRALRVIEGQNLLPDEGRRGAKKVLTAAAMTYVAALLVSVMQLLHLVLRFGGRRRDD